MLYVERGDEGVKKLDRVHACLCERGLNMAQPSRTKSDGPNPYGAVRPFADVADHYGWTAVPPRAGALAVMSARQAETKEVPAHAEEAPKRPDLNGDRLDGEAEDADPDAFPY